MFRFSPVAVLLCGLAALSPADAADREVDLELVLAADISRSMDLDEAELQRKGYASALRHPAIIGAIGAGALGRIAVTYMEWAGEYTQRTVVEWTEISDAASAEAVARQIESAEIDVARRTSISAAMLDAAQRFDGNGFRSRRQIIDISGDGPNNNGLYVLDARTRVLAAGITINGLPIIAKTPNPTGFPMLENLDLYYEDCVIGGTGAFMVVADGFLDFARAIRRKMFLEIADARVPARLLHLAVGRERPPCDAGEKQLREWMYDFN